LEPSLVSQEFEHIHLLIFLPEERMENLHSWGFFHIEKLENLVDKNSPPDHTVEFYLYPDG